MKYHLTLHARNALEKRQILIEWMEQILFDPEWTEPDSTDAELRHYLGRIQDFQNRVLRVVVNTKADPPRIVTAYFDRRSKRP